MNPLQKIILEAEKEFDEIIGEIPDKAIMQKFGKEFCVMCGRPTKNDKTVIELKNHLHLSLLKVVEGMREDTDARRGMIVFGKATEDYKVGYLNALSDLSSSLDEVIKKYR